MKRQSLYNRSSSAPFTRKTFLYFLSLDLERLWEEEEKMYIKTASAKLSEMLLSFKYRQPKHIKYEVVLYN